MNNREFLSRLMKLAHNIARQMEGHYSVRIKLGLMQAWKILKNSMPKTSPKAVTKAVTTEAMKKPATKEEKPLFYELTYTVKSAKMWTKHGKHRLYVKFAAQWKDYWAGKLTDFNDEFYVFIDLLKKNKVVPLSSRGEILISSKGRVRDAIADQVGQEVAENREFYIAETKKKIAEWKKQKAEEKRREEEERKRRAEEQKKQWEEERKRREMEYNSGPRYFRATRSGYDAETGERIYEGDLIYYSEIHGGYCKADNY